MTGEKSTTQEEALIKEQGKKIWTEVEQHVNTLPHGNGQGCNEAHSTLDRTIVVNFYHTLPMEVDHDDPSILPNADKVGVIAITRRFGTIETETSSWRFTKEGDVIREGVLIRPGSTSRFSADFRPESGLDEQGALDPTLGDLTILLGIAKNPNANIGDAKLLSRLPRGPRSSVADSPRRIVGRRS
jgi:hypothetical protein